MFTPNASAATSFNSPKEITRNQTNHHWYNLRLYALVISNHPCLAIWTDVLKHFVDPFQEYLILLLGWIIQLLNWDPLNSHWEDLGCIRWKHSDAMYKATVYFNVCRKGTRKSLLDDSKGEYGPKSCTWLHPGWNLLDPIVESSKMNLTLWLHKRVKRVSYIQSHAACSKFGTSNLNCYLTANFISCFMMSYDVLWCFMGNEPSGWNRIPTLPPSLYWLLHRPSRVKLFRNFRTQPSRAAAPAWMES